MPSEQPPASKHLLRAVRDAARKAAREHLSQDPFITRFIRGMEEEAARAGCGPCRATWSRLLNEQLRRKRGTP